MTETRARAMMVVEDALLEGNASSTPATTSTTGRVLLVCACGAYEAEEEEEEEEEDDAKKKKIGLVTNSESCWSIRARGGGGDDDDDDDDDAIVEINGEPCVRFFAKKKGSDATSTTASGVVVVGIRAVGFASSRKHYYCATSVSEKRNELLLSGWNQFGQLGDGSCQSRAPNDFRPVPLFERMRIRVRKVALGLFHSVVLCEGGSVYGFGANPQIGAPKEVKYSTVPRLIEGGDLRDDDDDDEIEFIGCGSRHTLVASKRRAFAFGCNAKRQCGFAPPEDANDDDGEDDDEEEERHNVYLPRETLSSSAPATTIAFVRCERWSSFVGVVQQ